MPQSTIIYACGAIISEQGRALVSDVHGPINYYYSKSSAVSVETYVPAGKDPIDELCNEAKITFDIDLKNKNIFECIDTSEIIIKNSIGINRNLKMFVYKIKGKCDLKVNTNRHRRPAFLQLNDISSINMVMELSMFSSAMLKRLVYLQASSAI